MPCQGHDVGSMREFRQGAVRIVRETRKPIARVARDRGAGEQTLGNWVKKDKIKRGEGEGLHERAELARLRSENAELRRERGCSQALRGRVGEGGDAVSLACVHRQPAEQPRRA